MEIQMKVTQEKTKERKTSVALYWDCQNVRVSLHQAKCLLNFAKVQGVVVIKRTYAYWRHENRSFEEALYGLDFECINIASFQKNSLDHKLIADCKSSVLNNPAIEIVIIVSGDGDFANLIRELKAKGKKVIVLAQPQVSQKLIKLANEFYAVSQISFCEQIA